MEALLLNDSLPLHLRSMTEFKEQKYSESTKYKFLILIAFPITDYRGINLDELQREDKFVQFGKTVGGTDL